MATVIIKRRLCLFVGSLFLINIPFFHVLLIHFVKYMKNFKVQKELIESVEQAEEMQISSRGNILSEQKYKLSYPLFQQMMYRSCQDLLHILKKKNHLSNGQLKLLAANLQEKVISKVDCDNNYKGLHQHQWHIRARHGI